MDGKEASLRLEEVNYGKKREMKDVNGWQFGDAAGHDGRWLRLYRARGIVASCHDAFLAHFTTALCIATVVSGLTMLSLKPL